MHRRGGYPVATLKPVLLAKHPWQLLHALPPPRRSQLIQPPQHYSTFNAKRIIWLIEAHGIRMSPRTLCLCLGIIAWRHCDLGTLPLPVVQVAIIGVCTREHLSKITTADLEDPP